MQNSLIYIVKLSKPCRFAIENQRLMKMLAVRNFFSASHLHIFQQIQLSLFIVIYFFVVITFLTRYKSSCLKLIVVYVTVTSEDVFWSIRNVQSINESYYNMRCLVLFITAVCLLFLARHAKYNSILKLSKEFHSHKNDHEPCANGKCLVIKRCLVKEAFSRSDTLFNLV